MASEQIESNVVLVIDDDEINLQMAKMILEKKLPCKVLTVDNGVQGLEILRRQYIQVVLLDVMMPYFDGIQTLQAIRSDEKLKKTAVIMLTASADKNTISKAIQLGVTDYVRKPFMPDELIERVSKKLKPVSKKSKIASILVIDDDELTLKRAKLIMENQLPYDVLVAASGIDGMEVLRKQKVNLVLASTEMSFINGFRILDFISNDAGLKNIPVMLMTSNDDEDMIARIRDAGAADYIKKPLTSDTVLDKIMKNLHGK